MGPRAAEQKASLLQADFTSTQTALDWSSSALVGLKPVQPATHQSEVYCGGYTDRFLMILTDSDLLK